jgi:hypothetical protein
MQFVWFAVIGLAVLVLAGPILGLVSVALSVALVLLPFVLIGFLAWAIFHAAVRGPHAALGQLREMEAKGHQVVRHYGGRVAPVLAWPFRAAAGVLGGVMLLVGWLSKTAWSSFWFLVEVALVAAAGVGVGAALGWVLARPPDVGAAVVSHALLGGALAAGVGLVLTFRERRAARAAAARPAFHG